MISPLFLFLSGAVAAGGVEATDAAASAAAAALVNTGGGIGGGSDRGTSDVASLGSVSWTLAAPIPSPPLNSRQRAQARRSARRAQLTPPHPQDGPTVERWLRDDLGLRWVVQKAVQTGVLGNKPLEGKARSFDFAAAIPNDQFKRS